MWCAGSRILRRCFRQHSGPGASNFREDWEWILRGAGFLGRGVVNFFDLGF